MESAIEESSKKIKILFLFYADPFLAEFTGGGLASYILMFLLSQDKMFDVYVVSTQYFMLKSRLKVERVKIFRGLPQKIRFILWILHSTMRSLKIIKRHRIDIVIGGGPTSPVTLLPAYLLKTILDKKIRVISFSQLPLLYRHHRLYATLLRRMDAIICSTSIVCRSFKREGIRRPMFIIGYGVEDPKEPIHVKKDIDCIFLGRITKEKGGLDLIKIAKEVIKRRPSTSFVAVGKVDKEILELARRSKAPIKYVGFVQRKQVWQYLARSKIMIYPSRYDSFAISVAEAMKMGLAVVTWDIPPFNEEYKGSGLVLVKSFDHEEFAKRVIELLENHEKIEELGEKNRKYAQRFRWLVVYKRFKRAIFKCLLLRD
jgi:glycosyltransferase involved in cell wall biosynthesis